MRNDRDDKYEGSENSEYHFSDDHYETDSGAAKQSGGGHDGMVENIGKSKRLYLSIGVLVVLVGVVYKIVTPSTTTPSTEISVSQTARTNSQTNAAQAMAQNTQAIPTQAPTTTLAQPAAPPQITPPREQSPIPPSTAMPDVIPVQSAPPVTVVNGAAPDAQILDNAGAAMTEDTKRMEAEIQAEYSKKLSEYQAENKLLQQQLQTLSSQVGLLESKMNQLVTTLNQQYQSNVGQQNTASPMPNMPAAATIPAPGAPSVEQAGPPPRIPYNVTAIIPGRAWLRSNNGDTLTVAEGDQIKGVGRVTKIDPYDGVIVIEMPSGKSISLSYGNSG